jgi:serine/threonine protein kinase
MEWGLNKSWTALMCAADKGYNDVVLALIDKEANVNAEDEGGNWTPLMCAARGNKGDNKDVVLTLMREKANYNFRDKKMGLTALTYAAQAGYKETVLALIEKGADPFACDRGWECGFLGTALDEAAREGRADIVVALVDIMAKKLSVDVHGPSKVEDFLEAVSRELITSAEEARRFDTVAAIRNVVISLQRDMIGHRNMPPTISIADQAGGASHDVTVNAGSSFSVNIDFRNLHMGRQLGRGSFGEVRLATWNSTEVAVKVLRQANNTPNGALENLRLEGKMLKDLQHPNIVQFFGMTCGPGDWPCIVMEYCSRGSVRRVLDKARNGGEEQRQLTWSRRLKMATDAAEGMLCLHQRTSSSAVLHRDLRSPNLLVDKDWKVKVRLCCVVVRAGSFGGGAGAADADLSPTRPQPSLASLNCNARNFFQVADFGLSKRIELARGQASMSTVCSNNPRWLAPEVLRGDQAGPPSDVFSFGVVMWELLTWEHPWSAEHAWNVADKIKNGERLSVPKEDQLPGLDNKDSSRNSVGDYIELMRRCWSQGPENRPKFKYIPTRIPEI